MRKAGSYEQGAASAVWLRPEELRPNPRNPRVHGAEVERLARTILRTTWGAPVVAQASTRRIIGGHGRVLAARMILAGILVEGRRLGGSTYKFSPDAPTTGVIPVRLVDVSDETADAMTLADNAQALQGVDDIDAVIALASTLPVGTLPLLDDIGISAEALAAVATLVPSATGDSPGAPKGVSAGDVRTSESLGVALGGPSRREGALTGEVRSSEDSAGDAVIAGAAGASDGAERHAEDGGDEADLEPRGVDSAAADAAADSRPGMVYELGPHRLVCGDSRDPAVWAQLLPGGERLQLVWTDPPYGVSIAGGPKDARNARFASGDTIANDDLNADELQVFLRAAFAVLFASTAPGAAWYVAAPAGPLFGVFGAELSALDVWRHTLVWVKQHFVFGRCDYHYRHEAIFYGWTPGAAHYFVDDRTQDSVLEFDRPSRSPEHPTMKPVALVRKCIENSSKPGWLVGEPFGGSGTTLIACAESGRVARVIELAPRYCDVIRRRWTRYAREAGIDPGPGALDP